MAEKGAHLTATSNLKPSIFEVLAQDSLAGTFHPALKRVATFLATCNPEKYGWIVNWYEEGYLAFNTLLQCHYLRCYGSSFAEAFYGLQRVPLEGSSPKFARLPREKEIKSLICLVVIPYLRVKLAERVTQSQLEGIPHGRMQHLLRLHSILHVIWEGIELINALYYLSGQALSHSPLLRLAGVTLQYAPEYENIANTRFPSAQFFGRLLVHALEFGAFFLQFLQWWHSGDKLRTSLSALPLPSPPQVTDKGKLHGGKCPICLQNRKIETVLSVSGYVFCYRCIVQHVQQYRACPVTKLPADLGDLVRIYSNDS